MLKNYVGTIAWLLVAILIASCGSSAATALMTAERLIAECARAMGGVEKIEALETMRFTQRFPDHGALVRYEIKRPNRVRMGDELVFDGERASWLDGKLVPQEEWKDFEVDIAWYFPAFFDYPAEYAGTETVDGIETHKLQVTLPLGAVMTYNLDAQTYLVYRATARFTIDDQEYHPERIYSDYRLQDGILYPHASTYEGCTGVFTATMETLEFNILLEDERFTVSITTTGGKPDAETTWAFSNLLIQEGQNTYDNLVTVARYGRFMKNNEIYVAILELLDGAEAQSNLYKKVGELFGESVREEVFAGIGVAPLGTPSTEKPRFMFPVIERLVVMADLLR